ncbi:MAG: carbohydrate-binding family V/XII, partial [Gemmatimonadales bacterium]|nr:carbohydrate-binding family V/XII [Gemmatimonadales bacterium]
MIVEAAFPDEVPIDMDRLSASLATAEREQRSLEGLKNEAPKIVFTDELAILLLYDGAPQSRAIPDTDLEQVLNTSLAVVKDTRSGTYWLSGGKVWYSAKDPLGPWTPNARPPEEITRIVPPDTSSDPAPDPPLAIVTATEPTELIVTDGPPKWQSLGGGELLYVENTENPILRAVDPAYIYILLSGRWFRAASFDGPWTFVHPDSLPASFEEIPPESPVAGVRVSVAGTQEAEDAMLDAQIPQTAAIERSKAKLEVTYDGEPQFTDIAGTKIAYATNTPAQVLRIDGRYYAVDEGVWFTAGSAKGPWAVADSVPEDEIQQIPPSAPVYNTTYVHVYESTPQVVYVGYYPGYMWSFPYYGVPVYGT